MSRIVIAVLVTVLGCRSVALAQDARGAELPWRMPDQPAASQPEQPAVTQPDQPAVTQPDQPVVTQPMAAIPDGRVVLSDAWMKHLDATERKQLAEALPFSVGFSLLAAGAWAGFAIYYAIEQGDAAGTLAMFVAAGANVAAAIAEVSTSDPYEQRSLGRWVQAGNFAMLATAAAFGAGNRGCDRDCSVVLGAVSAVLAVQVLTFAAFEIFLPPLYVSRRYAEYGRMTDARRPQFALDFLRAQEARARYAQYARSAAFALSGLTCVALAAHVDRGSSKQVLAGFGVVAFIGAIVAVLQTGSTTPRDHLLAGDAPPKPKAF